MGQSEEGHLDGPSTIDRDRQCVPKVQLTSDVRRRHDDREGVTLPRGLEEPLPLPPLVADDYHLAAWRLMTKIADDMGAAITGKLA